MSELAATLREALAVLAASDRSYKRFGAYVHRYELAPPLAEIADVPDDVRAFVTTVGASGAGPYYGFALGPRYRLGDRDARAIGHLGCGYAAVLVDGAVWIDARAIGIVQPMHATFTAYYLDWIDRLAHNALPDAFVPPGACALASALGGYLGVHEQRLGLAPGTITGEALADVLAQLGPAAIEIAAQQSPLYPDGARVPPCVACARLLANLGLSDDIVAR
ncbi:MAG TPA: hypothetical protein VK427_02320 [Kofleriaceae bacterium]|nr:hypothetical protein [Kofleriaceae bacterium]